MREEWRENEVQGSVIKNSTIFYIIIYKTASRAPTSFARGESERAMLRNTLWSFAQVVGGVQ